MLKIDLGASKFRPRSAGSFIPSKEGDEFGGVDQGGNLGVTFHKWVMLYTEAAAALVVFAVLWPLTVPWLLYVLFFSDHLS